MLGRIASAVKGLQRLPCWRPHAALGGRFAIPLAAPTRIYKTQRTVITTTHPQTMSCGAKLQQVSRFCAPAASNGMPP